MDPSSEQHQEMPAAHSLDMLVCSKSQQDQRKPRPQPEQALKCPRCDSTNTKFCYYNNYSLSQPRYFCKACRRYWTKGGTLRNVPVGGGCRKNKRSSSSSSASSKRSQDQPLTPNSNSNNNPLLPSLAYDSNDLTLAFARLQQRQSCGQLGFDDHHDHHLSILGNPTSNHIDILGNTSAAAAAPGLFDALRTGFLETHNNNFQNLYYGFGNGNNNNNLGDQVEDGGGVGGDPMGLHNPYDHQEMTNATTTAVTVTTMKQELCNARDQSETNRVLWGFPWQLNGDVNMGSGECDAGRESWNGLSSSWHGLLHSPLV